MEASGYCGNGPKEPVNTIKKKKKNIHFNVRYRLEP